MTDEQSTPPWVFGQQVTWLFSDPKTLVLRDGNTQAFGFGFQRTSGVHAGNFTHQIIKIKRFISEIRTSKRHAECSTLFASSHETYSCFQEQDCDTRSNAVRLWDSLLIESHSVICVNATCFPWSLFEFSVTGLLNFRLW